MIPKFGSLVRITVIAGLAIIVAVTVVGFSGVPPKIHSLILGAGAILFAISEIFFRNLISEFSAVLRRGGYSVWQMEQLQQQIPMLRKQVWSVWNLSMWMKAAVGMIAALLQWDSLPLKYRNLSVYAGYAILIITFALSFWAQRNFRRVEKWCDDVAAREIEVKEQKRTKAEMTSGNPHDFQSDSTLRTYSNPPKRV